MTTNEVRGLNAYHLASLADCASPDSDSSPGAEFLLRVADDVAELMTAGSWDDDDSPFEAADACVPIYTHDVWRTFTDLAAWQEDPTELGADASDMEQAATGAPLACGSGVPHGLPASRVAGGAHGAPVSDERWQER